MELRLPVTCKQIFAGAHRRLHACIETGNMAVGVIILKVATVRSYMRLFFVFFPRHPRGE